VSEDHNKTIARRVFEEVFTGGDAGLIEELWTADLVFHHPDEPYVTRGHDGLKARYQGYRTALPDLNCPIEDIFADGDRVAIRYTTHGTNTGEIMGAAPTGRKVTIKAIAIYRFENGKVTEMWDAWDVHALMRDLGFLSEPESTGASAG
jgi:steroid delta-isomerase-like uncharacterized protein